MDANPDDAAARAKAKAEAKKEARRVRILNRVVAAISFVLIGFSVGMLESAPTPGAGQFVSVAVFAAGLFLPFAVLAFRGARWARQERRRWDELMRRPAPERADEAETAALSADDVAAAFSGRIPPEPLSGTYRAGLALVAAALVLLLLIYVGLVALVVAVVFRYAVGNAGILSSDTWAIWRLAIYAGPIGIGAILAFFLVKPLVAPRIVTFRPHLVSAETQPALVAFVHRMADCVGAARPVRIELTCEVNASAGWDSLRDALRGRAESMGLTLGLPLMAGLNAQELGHVVSHELAHCTQRQGLRLSAFIRALNFWFARIIYERDMWDEMLSGYHEAGAGRAVVLLAKPCIKLTRGVLWCLGWAGSAISNYFSRQLEFDADRCAVQVAGIEAFESGQRRVVLLDFAASAAHNDLAASWERRRLCDNLPSFILASVDRLPKDAVDKALTETYKAKTQLFDSHPSPGVRLVRAKRVKPRDVFRLEGPASSLVLGFDPLARRLTFDFFRGMLGEDFVPSDVVATSLFLRDQTRFDDEAKALGRCCGGVYCMQPPVRFGGEPAALVADAPPALPVEWDLPTGPALETDGAWDVPGLSGPVPEGTQEIEALDAELVPLMEAPPPEPAAAPLPAPETPPPAAPAEPQGPEARLRLARERIEALAQAARVVAQDQPALSDKRLNVEIAGVLEAERVPFQPKAFGLLVTTTSALMRRRAELESEWDGGCATLAEFLGWFVMRMESALELLATPAVREKVPDADALAAEAKRLLDVLRVLVGAWDDLVSLRRNDALATWEVQLIRKPPYSEFPVGKFVDRFKLLARQCRRDAAAVSDKLASATYPFEHGRGTVTLAAYVVGELPEPEDFAGILGTSEAILAKAPQVYYQVLGRLAATAERVESALGMAPSPEPPAEPEPQALP